MLSLVQHLTRLRTYETPESRHGGIQGDKSRFLARPAHLIKANTFFNHGGPIVKFPYSLFELRA